MKFAIFTKTDKDVSSSVNLLLEQCEKYHFIRDDVNPELVFVFGGDGTFLKAVHHYLDQLDNIKMVGINCGSLGFFYDFFEKDIPHLFDLLINKSFCEAKHNLIECQVGDKKIYAVNEIRFEDPFHTMVTQVNVDDEYLENFRGNGLLVCNELGSTAYNKSLGGAVISSNISALQLTEIASIQNNIYRSLGSSYVCHPDTVFTFSGNFSSVVLGYDFLTMNCGDVDKIVVKTADKKVTIIHDKNHNNLHALKRSFIK